MTYNISKIKNCHTSKMRINHTTGHISEIQLITNQKYNLKYIRRITYNISKIKLVTHKKYISKIKRATYQKYNLSQSEIQVMWCSRSRRAYST